MKYKKAAFEMSITTIVVLVIAMTMLILGLVLVRNIFTGASENVLDLNEKIKGQINELFTEETTKTAIYLSNYYASIKQGETFGVAFGIRNIGQEGVFSYGVAVSQQGTCQSSSAPSSWIVVGQSESGISIGSGDVYYSIIRFQPPLDAPLCTARFRVEIKKDNQAYDSFSFDVEIKPK